MVFPPIVAAKLPGRVPAIDGTPTIEESTANTHARVGPPPEQRRESAKPRAGDLFRSAMVDQAVNDAVAAIRRHIVDGLSLGHLECGDRLPSVREMARMLNAPAKTVLLAYRILGSESLVEVRSRSGVFVSAPKSFTARSSEKEWFIDMLVEARRRGITPAMMATFVTRHLANVSMRAVVLDRNADQLWSISDELHRDYGIGPMSFDLDEVERNESTRAQLNAAVADSQLIVTTSAEARAVRAILARPDVPMCAAVLCPTVFSEARQRIASGLVYFLVSDPRLASRINEMFGNEARQNLRILVLGEGLPDISLDAAVYLTRLTRQRLAEMAPDHPLLTRTLPQARVFSEETARELSRLLVSTNSVATP